MTRQQKPVEAEEERLTAETFEQDLWRLILGVYEHDVNPLDKARILRSVAYRLTEYVKWLDSAKDWERLKEKARDTPGFLDSIRALHDAESPPIKGGRRSHGS
jgi:hypothetical protein